MLFAFSRPMNFDFLLVNLALAALRPKARRIGRSLVTERAPDGTGLSGSTDPVCAGWRVPRSQGPRSLWPRSALEEPSRQRGALALGVVVGALGKPYASAQAGRGKPKPDLLHILRESVAVLPLASLALQDSRFFCENFWNFSS